MDRFNHCCKRSSTLCPIVLIPEWACDQLCVRFGLIGMTSCITKSAQIEGTLEELMEEENLALEELGEPIMQVDPFAAKLTLLSIYFFMQLPYLILLLTYLLFS